MRRGELKRRQASGNVALGWLAGVFQRHTQALDLVAQALGSQGDARPVRRCVGPRLLAQRAPADLIQASRWSSSIWPQRLSCEGVSCVPAAATYAAASAMAFPYSV